MVDDIRYRELISEAVPSAHFEFNVSIEFKAVIFYGPSRNVLLAVVYDNGVEVFKAASLMVKFFYLFVLKSVSEFSMWEVKLSQSALL